MAATAKESAFPSATMRRDAWWVQPSIVFLVLFGFIVYSTYRTFENNFFTTFDSDLWIHGRVGDLLSPFYSPYIPVNWTVLGKHISPALLILPFPLSFRLTCYYYRKAYYRAFFWSPPACAVPGPVRRPRYTGEKFFPFILQNLHRYAFYAAFILIFILAFDIYKSTRFIDGWGISVGTVVLFLNVLFLSCYTFGCHSWRHLVGGGLDCYSCNLMSKTRYGFWKKVTFLNESHAFWAWVSLFGVALTDLYIRLVSSGVITDYVFFKVTNG